jgi:hypothetical protein
VPSRQLPPVDQSADCDRRDAELGGRLAQRHPLGGWGCCGHGAFLPTDRETPPDGSRPAGEPCVLIRTAREGDPAGIRALIPTIRQRHLRGGNARTARADLRSRDRHTPRASHIDRILAHVCARFCRRNRRARGALPVRPGTVPTPGAPRGPDRAGPGRPVGVAGRGAVRADASTLDRSDNKGYNCLSGPAAGPSSGEFVTT